MKEARDAVRLEEVHKVYYTSKLPVIAVNGVTLGIRPGEFLVLMGPSGCGKSTLLHLMGGVDRPTSGRVLIGGRNLVSLSDNELSDFRRDSIGFVFQSYNLIPSLTAAENIEIPLMIKGLGKKDRDARVAEILRLVDLRDRSDHTPSMLSGGEEQRVAIGRALANDPTVVLLDEPTGNLDQGSGRAILELVSGLNRNKGKTLCMVTHDRALAGYGTRLVEMVDGKMKGEEK
ncbi:MAG: ABC transporter ATP-binding protein [Euryarchaeota archaeon]|nr:ABC transporter ATP-binding protein [Euryarchaeota archaeon]